jgi:macrolide-specific efflux system membrane fusion protein
MKLDSRWVMLGCGLALAAAMAGFWVDGLALTAGAWPWILSAPATSKGGAGDGVLKPAVQVNVGAQVNGQLRKLYVRQESG